MVNVAFFFERNGMIIVALRGLEVVKFADTLLDVVSKHFVECEE